VKGMGGGEGGGQDIEKQALKDRVVTLERDLKALEEELKSERRLGRSAQGRGDEANCIRSAHAHHRMWLGMPTEDAIARAELTRWHLKGISKSTW
jgi:hypothetical protein